MLSTERHETILELLQSLSTVSVAELGERFSVSEMTIRRDLEVLERKGLLHRVHGGAVSSRGRSYEPPFLKRSSENALEKERIGRAAAALVNNGDSITLDVGTTTLEIARSLSDKQDLTIITPSLPIANLLAEQAGIRLIVTGGILRRGELSLVGNLAERVFEEFFVDKLFLGIGAVDCDTGLTEFNIEDALVKRAMLRTAKEVIVVAHSNKFGRQAFAAVSPLHAVKRIVTDEALDPEVHKRLEDMGIEMVLA